MIPSQAIPRHELLPKQLQAHRMNTMALQTINLGSGEYSNAPELLVAAAWSVAAARWFYTSEVDFRVTIDKACSTFPVRVSVGPEVGVGNLLQQLKCQMGLEAHGDSSEMSGPEEGLSRKFCIVYETGKVENYTLHTRYKSAVHKLTTIT